jgi:hypothetical protein
MEACNLFIFVSCHCSRKIPIVLQEESFFPCNVTNMFILDRKLNELDNLG